MVMVDTVGMAGMVDNVDLAGMVDNMPNTLDPAVVQFSDQDDLDSAVVAFHCRV